MGRALEIRDDLSAAELRVRATREKKNRVARRMLAIANALDGMSRAEAARAAGMDRQALRDAVLRYNAEGLAGLHDRPTPGRPPALTGAELALLSARILDGPDPETDGVSSWTLPDLCRWIEARFDKLLPPQSLSRILMPTAPETDRITCVSRIMRQRLTQGYRSTPGAVGIRPEGFSRQKTRPTHPKADEAAREGFEKGGSRRHWRRPARLIPASG